MLPCQQTENITDIKINMARFEEKLDANVAASARIEQQLADHIRDSKADQKELADTVNNTVNAFIEEIKKANAEAAEANKKQFSGKWVEKFIVRAGWIIATPILGASGYFIYKLVQHVIAP